MREARCLVWRGNEATIGDKVNNPIIIGQALFAVWLSPKCISPAAEWESLTRIKYVISRELGLLQRLCEWYSSKIGSVLSPASLCGPCIRQTGRAVVRKGIRWAGPRLARRPTTYCTTPSPPYTVHCVGAAGRRRSGASSENSVMERFPGCLVSLMCGTKRYMEAYI